MRSATLNYRLELVPCGCQTVLIICARGLLISLHYALKSGISSFFLDAGLHFGDCPWNRIRIICCFGRLRTTIPGQRLKLWLKRLQLLDSIIITSLLQLIKLANELCQFRLLLLLDFRKHSSTITAHFP